MPAFRLWIAASVEFRPDGLRLQAGRRVALLWWTPGRPLSARPSPAERRAGLAYWGPLTVALGPAAAPL